MPAPHLLNPDCNMYFSDFYCIYAIHYVTVVVTRPGSLADQFCAKQLVRLSPRDNVFICVRPSIYDGRLEYWVNGNVWVEMLVTEDVDIRVGRFSLVRSTGESTPGGLKNNRFCQICNLYPKEPKTMEEIAIAQGQKAISDASRPNKLPLNTNSDSAKRVKANEYGNKTSTSALIASLLVNLEAEKNFPVDDEDKLSLSNVTMEAVLDAIGEFQSVPDRSVAICDVATVLCSIVDRVVVESDFKTEIASILEELVNRAVKICEQVENPLTLKRKRKSTEIEEDYDYSDSEVPSTSGNSTGTQLESFFEGNDLSEIPDYEAKFQEWIQSVNTSTSTMQSSESNTTSAPLENEVGAEEIKMTPVKNVYPWTNELYQPPEPSKPPEISPPKSVTKGFLSPPTQISDASKAVKQRANVVETHKQVDVNMNQSHKTTLRSKIQNEAVPQQRIQDTSRSRYASLPNRPNLILITSQADPNAQVISLVFSDDNRIEINEKYH